MLRPWQGGTIDGSGVGRLEELVQDGEDAVHGTRSYRLWANYALVDTSPKTNIKNDES